MIDDKSIDEKIGGICGTCRKFTVTRHYKEFPGGICNHCYGEKHFHSAKAEEVKLLLNILCTKDKTENGVLTNIGNVVGLSRERVRQIANKMGRVSTRQSQREARMKACVWCGKTFDPRRTHSKYCSVACGRLFRHQRYWETKTCTCGRNFETLKSRSTGFCSNECRLKSGRRPFKNVEMSEVKRMLGNPFTMRKVMVSFKVSRVGAKVYVTKLTNQKIIKSKNIGKHKYIYLWKNLA